MIPLEATLCFLDVVGHTVEVLGPSLNDGVNNALAEFKKIVGANGGCNS